MLSYELISTNYFCFLISVICGSCDYKNDCSSTELQWTLEHFEWERMYTGLAGKIPPQNSTPGILNFYGLRRFDAHFQLRAFNRKASVTRCFSCVFFYLYTTNSVKT
jgi:hypothetical protein